jgi:hypothetical protein
MDKTIPVLVELTKVTSTSKDKILVPPNDIVASPSGKGAPTGAQTSITVHGTNHHVAETMDQIVALCSGEVPAKQLSSLAWAAAVAPATGGTVTAKTVTPHNFPVNSTQNLVIATAVPTGYNGPFTCTVTDASTFTYLLTTDPGLATAPGTYALIT